MFRKFNDFKISHFTHMHELRDLIHLTEHLEDDSNVFAIYLGLLLPVFAARPEMANIPLKWHVDRIDTALSFGQIALCFDRFGRQSGHAIWTGTNQDTERLLIASGPLALDASQIAPAANSNTWLLDFAAEWNTRSEMIARGLAEWFRDHAELGYFHQKNQRRTARRMRRGDALRMARPCAGTPTAGPLFLASSEGSGLLHAFKAEIGAALERGLLLRLMSTVPEDASLPLWVAINRLRVPLSLYQHRIYRGENGNVSGFLTWAWLTDQNMAKRPLSLLGLHPHEWNDGRRLCLMDGVIGPDVSAAMIRDISEELFPEEDLSVCTLHTPVRTSQLRSWSSRDRIAIRQLLGDIQAQANITNHLVPRTP